MGRRAGAPPAAALRRGGRLPGERCAAGALAAARRAGAEPVRRLGRTLGALRTASPTPHLPWPADACLPSRRRRAQALLSEARPAAAGRTPDFPVRSVATLASVELLSRCLAARRPVVLAAVGASEARGGAGLAGRDVKAAAYRCEGASLCLAAWVARVVLGVGAHRLRPGHLYSAGAGVRCRGAAPDPLRPLPGHTAGTLLCTAPSAGSRRRRQTLRMLRRPPSARPPFTRPCCTREAGRQLWLQAALGRMAAMTALAGCKERRTLASSSAD